MPWEDKPRRLENKRLALLTCGCHVPVGYRVEVGQEIYCSGEHKFQTVKEISEIQRREPQSKRRRK